MFRSIFVSFAIVAIPVSSLHGETFELAFDQAPPSMYVDRWMYPFNFTPGTRITAPTFGAVGAPSTDERDGQFLIGINTERLGIPTGGPASRYRIESARLVLTEAVGGYLFDPTYDSYQTYLDSSTLIAKPDEDPGRPVELYGLGFRNGFEKLGFPDGGSSTDGPVFSSGSRFGNGDRGTRNAFAVDAQGSDVSNNLDSLNEGIYGFDPTPFSVGQAFTEDDDALDSAAEVQAGMKMLFDIDVNDPAITAYLQHGLEQGQLGFVISSLHDAGLQGNGDPYVNLATSNHFAVPGPRFEITVVLDETSLKGDFDASGQLDITDVDLLMNEIRQGAHARQFDLTDDNQVDVLDLTIWVRELFGSHLGDANLDGQFNSRDFVEVFEAGEYEDLLVANSTWATGDWNADGEFDSGDLVVAFQDGGYLFQATPRSVAVPEPTSFWGLSMIGFVLAELRRCRLRSRHSDAATRSRSCCC